MPRGFDRNESYKRLIDAVKSAENQCTVIAAIDEDPQWVRLATAFHIMQDKCRNLANRRRVTKLFDALGRPLFAADKQDPTEH